MDELGDRWWYLFAGLWGLLALGALLSGCQPLPGTVRGEDETVSGCVLDDARLPVERLPPATYAGRRFLADGNHLGWDILLPEGEAVHPIGCGVIRLARAAQGYGTLAVVIEHRLAEPAIFANGRGEQVSVDRFLSIYGHLRPTADRAGQQVPLPLRPGGVVTPDMVIGYVQHRALNGDGDEHLHLGIRLQGADAAQRTDPAAWFRGYDSGSSYRRWYADPEDALARLQRLFRLPDPPVPDVSDPLAAMSVDRPLPPEMSPSPPARVMDAGSPAPPVPSMVADAGGSQPLPTVPPPVRDAAVSLDVGSVPRIRYEFRIRSSLRTSPPYRLRDQWWASVACRNTGSYEPALLTDGWARCEAEPLAVFDGSVFLPDHPDWGDRGQIGTVANVPKRCTPVDGAEWRITDLASGRLLFSGPVHGLRCVAVGTQDRLRFPE